MEGDKHYLFGAIMGAVLGGIVGNAVTIESDGRINALPRISADGSQMLLYIDLQQTPNSQINTRSHTPAVNQC